MSEGRLCPECGAELAADVPQGLCPACLLKRGLETQTAAGKGASAAAAADAVPPTPTELAAYFPDLEILELVGRGGMGVVYKARQKRLDRLVALKILSPSVGKDPAFAERFTREARALAMLNHPNIVTVHDFGQTDDLFYFLMEYVDGVSLRQLLDTGKLAPSEALAIVPQICDALQYAHDAGIVHRDIKPENILLDKQGRVKIADFGLAKLMGRTPGDMTLTSVGQVMGTPHYMAPEQMEKPQTVDHRADIYSLGVVFYQMLTGELPLGRFAPPSRKVQIDVRLDEVVLRALEKEPERRYQQASEMKTEVEVVSRAPAASAVSGPVDVAMPRQQVPSVQTAHPGTNHLGLWALGTLIATVVLPLLLLGIGAAAQGNINEGVAAVAAILAVALLILTAILGIAGRKEKAGEDSDHLGLHSWYSGGSPRDSVSCFDHDTRGVSDKKNGGNARGNGREHATAIGRGGGQAVGAPAKHQLHRHEASPDPGRQVLDGLAEG